MEGKSYEIVDAFISRYPGNDKILFVEDELRRNEIFRGLAGKWREFKKEDFVKFANKNKISTETPIAIAQDGDIFAVIKV